MFPSRFRQLCMQTSASSVAVQRGGRAASFTAFDRLNTVTATSGWQTGEKAGFTGPELNAYYGHNSEIWENKLWNFSWLRQKNLCTLYKNCHVIHNIHSCITTQESTKLEAKSDVWRYLSSKCRLTQNDAHNLSFRRSGRDDVNEVLLKCLQKNTSSEHTVELCEQVCSLRKSWDVSVLQEIKGSLHTSARAQEHGNACLKRCQKDLTCFFLVYI